MVPERMALMDRGEPLTTVIARIWGGVTLLRTMDTPPREALVAKYLASPCAWVISPAVAADTSASVV